jgi:Kef-type K+ transport system membrane component KefB
MAVPTPDLGSIAVVAAAIAAAPIIASSLRRLVVPTVVVEMLLGILIGPQVLDLAGLDPYIEFLSGLGLAFLFLVAGMEIDLDRVRGTPITFGGIGWLISLALGLGAATLLYATDLVGSVGFVGIALATTALGTLMPILRDAGALNSKLGLMTIGVGVAGEFLPIVVIALFLNGTNAAVETVLLAFFLLITFGAASLALRARPPAILNAIAQTLHASGQLAVRLVLVTLAFLVWLADTLELDYILGAFAAGLIVGLVTRGELGAQVRIRVEGVAFGLFVPIFFVVSGMEFDLEALVDSWSALALLPICLLLLLLVRGLPALALYFKLFEGRDRRALALFSATALPLIVAITSIGVEKGDLASDEAAALVGAGMLSVLLFPLIGLKLVGRKEVPTTLEQAAREA